MTLPELLDKHDLSQRTVAQGTGVPLSSVNDIVNRKRQPTTGTVNKLLHFLRKYEPRVSYEELFAPELVAGRGRVA